MNVTALPVSGPTTHLPARDSDALISVIERMARDPSVDLARLEKVLDIAQGIRDRDAELAAEGAFNASMSAVQARMSRVAADASNRSTNSRYATYAALDRALRPLYSAEGFALTFNEEEGAPADHVRIVCYVSHTAAGAVRSHTRKYRKDMPNDGKGAKGGDVMTKTHASGSAQTYAQRYLLKMIFNIAIGDDPDDDDGNAVHKTTEAYTPPAGSITQDQADNIRDALEAKGASRAAFLQWAKQKRIEDIPAEHYDACITAINKFRKV